MVAAVLVIGGTGIMGAPTVRHLLAAGHRTVVLSRGKGLGAGTGGRRPEFPEGAEVLTCDRNEPNALKRALCDSSCPRVVVDFMGMVPGDLAAIVEAHRERPLSHYVFISTNMVYPGGPGPKDISPLPQPVAEEAAEVAAAEAAPDDYGGRKLRCEAALRLAGQEHGLPFTVVRPPSVVGPGCDDRHERLQRLVLGLEALPPKGQWSSCAAPGGAFRVVYSGDVAALIASAVAKGEVEPEAVLGEAFNVAAAEATTLEEYLAAVAVAAGLPPPAAGSVPLPSDGGDDGDPMLRNYERQGSLDISKASRVLGYRPTPLAEWMKATVAWHGPWLVAPAAL